MHRCYAPGANLQAATTLDIEGEEAKHALKVMRLRVGDVCEVFNGCGQAATGRIAATSGSSHMTLAELTPLPAMPTVPARSRRSSARCRSADKEKRE